MKEYVFEEFIEYNRKFSKQKHDFSGTESPLGQEEQKRYLRKFVEYYKEKYGENLLFEKAVDKIESENIARNFIAMDENVNTFTAYRKEYISLYQNWFLYTDRAKIDEGVLRLIDGYQLKEFRFRVKIGKGFYHHLREGILSTTTGRFIELRHGCSEVIKLYFAPDGTFCYKDGAEEEYHYELYKIGKYEFDKWFEVRLVLDKGNFTLYYENKAVTLQYSNDMMPDNLFLGGGMQPTDEWCFEPIECLDVWGKRLDMFIPSTREAVEAEIGSVVLPFVLGTEREKDNSLILRKKFRVKEGFEYALEIGALDPGGEIFINGNSIVRKDDFTPFVLRITDFVKVGENELTIEVFPRAPEVLFAWHKNKDYYNGWFCLSANIRESRLFIPSDVEVETKRVDVESEFLVRWKTPVVNATVQYKVYLQKIFPNKGEKVLLSENTLKEGSVEELFTYPVKIWDVEDPHLYKIIVSLVDENGNILCEKEQETGFRTVEQKNGAIYLNGKKTILKGALSMQFLPPFEEIPLNHVCPSNVQIIEQVLSIKRMNGNCMRMHQLGYGCGDKRFASICDRLGILLIWTTRLIDSAENMQWTDTWLQAKDYQRQINHVKNHPSIIMCEGSNELHTDLEGIDRLYDIFVNTVKEVDNTRILCPISHLYYGGGIYNLGCKYYNTAGTQDEEGISAEASFGWKDKNVVRSAHTYTLLLGYGSSWKDMVEQKWKWQPELFNDQERAYIISEYAIIGRQNPETDEAKQFINKQSYELSDEYGALGYLLADNEWELSQAHQALCAGITTKQIRKLGADGMLWCCLSGGANNASYLKPILDFYGYKKLAFYRLKESFQDVMACNMHPDVLYYPKYGILPVLFGVEDKTGYSLCIEVVNAQKEVVDSIFYKDCQTLEEWKPNIIDNGFYTIRYILQDKA